MKKKEVQFRSGGALSQVELVMLVESGHKPNLSQAPCLRIRYTARIRIKL